MNREEYLKQLKAALQGLPEDELQDILYDYKEHFDIGLSKGKSEAEISMELGDPREVAHNYKSISSSNHADNDYVSNDNNYDKDINFSKDVSRKTLTKRTLAILAGITLVVLGSSLLYFNISSNRFGNFINVRSGSEIVSIGGKGIQVKDGNSYVSIGWNGIKVTDGKDNVSVGWNGIRINGENVSKSSSGSKDLVSKTIDEEKLESLDGISSISAISSFVDIKIIPQERNDVRIHYHGSLIANVIPELNINKASSNLEIKLETPKNTSINVRESDLVLEIFVPAAFIGDYNVVTSSGEVEVRHLEGDNFKITSSSGDVILENINSKVLNTTTSSGIIGIKNYTGDLNMSSSSGDIYLDTENTSGDINLSTSSGDIVFKLSDKVSYKIKGSTSSGNFDSNIPMTVTENKNNKFNAIINEGNKEIKITTSSGDVRFDRR